MNSISWIFCFHQPKFCSCLRTNLSRILQVILKFPIFFPQCKGNQVLYFKTEKVWPHCEAWGGDRISEYRFLHSKKTTARPPICLFRNQSSIDWKNKAEKYTNYRKWNTMYLDFSEIYNFTVFSPPIIWLDFQDLYFISDLSKRVARFIRMGC